MNDAIHTSLLEAAKSAPCNGCQREPLCAEHQWTCPKYRRWETYGDMTDRSKTHYSALSQLPDQTLDGDALTLSEAWSRVIEDGLTKLLLPDELNARLAKDDGGIHHEK